MKLVIADSVYGIAGVLVLYSGYLRVTQYGKGWEFYSHEPIFWFKMFLFAVTLFVMFNSENEHKQNATKNNAIFFISFHFKQTPLDFVELLFYITNIRLGVHYRFANQFIL